MIMAYDALIDCDGLWEKLIFYAMLHPGDSDTVGAIAGGLYGILYGYGDVPEKMLCCIEEKDRLIKLGKKFYKKFYPAKPS
jgi:ADP-ribosyl-[dinitrogen reductase] hydrolase